MAEKKTQDVETTSVAVAGERRALEPQCTGPFSDARDCPVHNTASRAGGAREQAEQKQLQKVRDYLCRLAGAVTKAGRYGFQVIRRDRDDGDIEYQIFADTKKGNGIQVGYIQSTRNDADFIAACLAQAPLFAELLHADAARPRSAPCQYWPITGTCPHCNKPEFVITCSVCGHKGCYRDCERHDCYGVFRERFAKAESK